MHVVDYRYSVEDDGCGCCQYMVSEMTVTQGDVTIFEGEVPYCQDDDDLKQRMADFFPEIEEYFIGTALYL